MHRHAETAYTHTLPLQNSIYQTFDGVLKKYVADVAYLRITLSPHTRIQHEAMAAKLFHYTLILSSSDYCGCVGGEVFVEKLGILHPWVNSENKLLHVVLLSVIEKMFHLRKTFLRGSTARPIRIPFPVLGV